MKHPVRSNETPCTQQWNTLYTAMKQPAHNNETRCTQQWKTLYTAIKHSVHSNETPCTQQYKFLLRRVNRLLRYKRQADRLNWQYWPDMLRWTQTQLTVLTGHTALNTNSIDSTDRTYCAEHKLNWQYWPDMLRWTQTQLTVLTGHTALNTNSIDSTDRTYCAEHTKPVIHSHTVQWQLIFIKFIKERNIL